MNKKSSSFPSPLLAKDEKALLAAEKEVCSYGDTVHYAEHPKIFERCEGSYLYDMTGKPYLDLQMWYSAVNLGYGNPRVNEALKRQIDKLPQLACQYLHREKIELAERIVESIKKSFGVKGRVHFNVGGSQAVEDALKLVRKHTGRSRMFAFEGGYHGRTLAASASEWRYLNVRRLFNMIEESIALNTRWIVFEPNDMTLWKSIRRDISAFLMRMWRDGALMGASAEQAFFVKCDAETNPPEVIDAGQVVVIIGVAPVKPAEFVVFRISQYAEGVQTENLGG